MRYEPIDDGGVSVVPPNDAESIAGSIAMLELEIAAARDFGTFDDVLDVCSGLLRLIERINERDMPL